MLPSSNVTDVKPAFSLELSRDLREMRDWVHEFAASVIRPAAADWDEREQTPWPILQEAAKIGLYSLDFFATQFFEESGLGIPVAYEELFWGMRASDCLLSEVLSPPCRSRLPGRLSRSASGARRCSGTRPT